jgi:hypothetical protein
MRRTELHGDAHARRRGALVQGRAGAEPADGDACGLNPRLRLALLAGGRPGGRAGRLQTLAFVHTLSLVAAAGRPGAVVAWRHCARARPRLAGLGFGIGWLGCRAWWLFISLHRYGGLAAWLAAAAVLLLAACWRCTWRRRLGAGVCALAA